MGDLEMMKGSPSLPPPLCWDWRPQPATCISRMSWIACLSIFVPWSVGLGLGSACPWLTGPSTACSHVGCWALRTLTVKGQHPLDCFQAASPPAPIVQTKHTSRQILLMAQT